MSEIHNVLLADQLSQRLGVNWGLRDRGERRNPAFEIDGIPDELIREFSSRTGQIEANLAALLEERADDLHPPTRREMYVLRQQATLLNRPPKHLAQPLASLMHEWRVRADRATGHHIADLITASLDQLGGRQLTSADISSETLDAYGAAVVLALQTKRSTWTRWNILAEAARQTRLLRLTSSQDRLDVLNAIADRAQEHSISLTVSDLIQAPASMSRRDGESVFTIHNGHIYTSPVVLGAEAVLLDLAQETTGPVIDRDQPDARTELSSDKAAVLERIVTSGQKVEALIGPAGTGKTSLLAALKDVWESAHGSGSVVALAPSAAAAAVLSDNLSLPADNIAKWIHEAVGLGATERRDWITRTEHAAQLAQRSGRRRRHLRLAAELAAARSEEDRWHFRPDQLVIVDEASMAGTMELATIARTASKAGAKLLLVGDDAQLGAVDTGGAFGFLARETQAAELTEVWRFEHAWERDASLALRQGHVIAIDQYDEKGRLSYGSSEESEDAAYKAWSADTARGQTSLLIAADNATVTRLNTRARLDRVITGEVEPAGVELHDGTQAGVGDKVVTRLNSRRLRIGRHGFVHNGSEWTVIRRWHDGSITVQNHELETVTLPATYVGESVELAYATTAHRAQGSTVDSAHLLVTDRMTRALLYVGMTRGRHSNRAYVVTHETATEMHEPVTKQTMQDVLETVLDQEGTERSAHEAMRDELDNATRLDRLVPIHEHHCQIAAAQRYETAIDSSGLDPADRSELQASSAYGPLLAALRRGEAAGLDVGNTLRRAVNQSSLNNAKDLAAVLHARVERIVSRTERRSGHHPQLVAGLVSPSEHITDPTFVTPLRELEALISQRADWLAEHAATEDQPWYQALQQSLSNASPSYRQSCTRDIAAYRERYDVRTQEVLGTVPPQTAYAHHRDRSRLAKMIRATQIADDATPPASADNHPQLPVP